MQPEKHYIIVDLKTCKALYGANGITMRFSTSEIAHEVAEQLFGVGKRNEYEVVFIKLSTIKN